MRSPFGIATTSLVSLLCLCPPLLYAGPPGGTPICRASGAQSGTAAAPDGAGGMFVVWLDGRRGASDLYAHRVAADGTLHPAWMSEGNPVTQSGTAGAPTLFSIAGGGVLFVWLDAAAGAVYAQRLEPDGSLAPGWPADGRLLVSEPLGGPSGRLFRWSADNGANLYVCWNTFDFTIESLLLQRFDGNGAAAWATPPVVGTAGLGGSRFTFMDMGASPAGVVVAWGSYEDLAVGWHAPASATRILSSGLTGYITDLVAPFGSSLSVRTYLTGLAVSAGGEAFVRARVDGVVRLLKLDAAGAIAWPADRSISADGRLVPDDAGGVYGLGGPGVLLDRRAADGTVPPGWSGSGMLVTAAAPSGAVAATIVPGGILLCWSDDARGRGADIRATGVTHGGSLAPGWPAGGGLVSSVRGVQTSPALVASAGGSGLAAWQDLRRDGGNIYGDVVTPAGAVAALGVRGLEMAHPDDHEGPPIAASGNPGLSLVVPPSAGGECRISFALAADGGATLDLVDVSGRLIQRQDVSGAVGTWRTTTLPTRGLPRGIYWARLREGVRQVSAKLLALP